LKKYLGADCRALKAPEACRRIKPCLYSSKLMAGLYWNSLQKCGMDAPAAALWKKSANKKGRDLSQNLSLGVESLLDPSHCYYSYS
jgi:hypothetical protein